jgi:hypothetical protein
MKNLLERFDAAYLINLPDRTDRRRSAERELARAGWELGKGGVRLFPACRFEERGTFPAAAIRGCFHSHMRCLSEANAAGAKSVLVMEDDIALSSFMSHATESIVRVMSSCRWDFLYFGHDDAGDIPLHTSPADVRFREYAGVIRGAHFYAVNGRILDRLVEHLNVVVRGVEGDQEFGPMPIDGAFNIFRWKNQDVQTLLAAPKLGWQRPSRSDISPRAFDGFTVLRPVVSALRELKSVVMRGYR